HVPMPARCPYATFSRSSLVEDWIPSPVTWPRSGMTRDGALYAHPTSAPHIGETGGSLSPTPRLLPTPRAPERENRQTRRTPSQRSEEHTSELQSRFDVV